MAENFVSEKDFKSFVIYKGQKFEADAAYIDIYQQANASIYVVDDYMNTKTLQLLSQKKNHCGAFGVSGCIDFYGNKQWFLCKPGNSGVAAHCA